MHIIRSLPDLYFRWKPMPFKVATKRSRPPIAAIFHMRPMTRLVHVSTAIP